MSGPSVVVGRSAIGRGVFANPGAWLDAPRFLRVTPERVELCHWGPAGRTVESALERAALSGS